MMCSHTPDTTRPMANPEKPLTKPPASAASAKRAKTGPSMGRLPKNNAGEHLDGYPSDGEVAGPRNRSLVWQYLGVLPPSRLFQDSPAYRSYNLAASSQRMASM